MISRKKAWSIISVFILVGVMMGAVTQIDLAKQAKGILAIANGGTGTGSTLTGLIRGSASSMSAAELSGDAQTSGSNVVTVPSVNGTSIPTNSSADQSIVTTASATGAWKALPNCANALQYSTSTHTYSCSASLVTGSFADNEAPTGTIDGANAVFTLAHTPSPAASLQLFKNGQLMVAGGADYTLATATATFVSGSKPQSGDVLTASYRW